MSSQFNLITQQLSSYFDGLYFSDVQKLKSVFHPKAHYSCATDGNLLNLNMPDYFAIVEKRESPAMRNETRRDRILSIELAGEVTAFAKVECSIGNKFFTDFLTLISVDNQWKIISKVFHYELLE